MARARRKPSVIQRILLVDDHPMIRACLSQLIAAEQDLTVCGEAESAPQALELALRTRPDLVILDLALKDSHGLDLIRDLRERVPAAAILVVSMHDAHLHASGRCAQERVVTLRNKRPRGTLCTPSARCWRAASI